MNLEFYRGKRVFVTGHTGFKGSWLCRMLVGAGAVVTGYSLEPPTTPNLFSLAGLEGKMTSVIGDIRNFASLKAAFDAARPEIVLHLSLIHILNVGIGAQAAHRGLFRLTFRSPPPIEHCDPRKAAHRTPVSYTHLL